MPFRQPLILSPAQCRVLIPHIIANVPMVYHPSKLVIARARNSWAFVNSTKGCWSFFGLCFVSAVSTGGSIYFCFFSFS